jgi:uncharacterized repeat protein (TIGR01451 family)
VTIINAAARADLTVTKTHSGNFTQGQIGATYTITVTNSGTAATTEAVLVRDILPAGLTPTNTSGAGWNCVVAEAVCVRSDVLAAAASYPPLVLTVNVARNASSGTNTVTVSGGGETNTGNNSASDVTTVDSISAPPAVIPTQSESILMLISALLALFGLYVLKRRVRG